MIYSSGQQVTFQTSFEGVLSQFTIIYAATTSTLRRVLWCDLLNIRSNTTMSWMAIGDFNAILGVHEQMGGHLPARTSCEDFRSTTELCDFTHMDTTGAFYTWTNGWNVRGYMERRLDRYLCDTRWLQSWPYTSCCALPRVISDHNCLVFSAFAIRLGGPRPFRFQSIWTLHSEFSGLVAKCWQSTIIYGCPMFVMLEKLKAHKRYLRVWNSNVFGDVHRNVTFAKERLHNIQNSISSDGNLQEKFNEEVVAKTAVLNALQMQEDFWHDRARVKWLTEGDRNTAFFHAYAQGRHSSSRVVTLLDGDNVLSSHTAIVDHVVNFYQSLYNSSFTLTGIEDVCGVIPPMVSEEENLSLSCLPSADEIRSVVFYMDPSNAPGPDGFPGSFYQSCWDIVGLDVIAFVQDFFKRGWLYPNANCNFVVLIEGVATIAQYRPIALANFLFKIIPKILADRLGPIATRIISPQQTTFLKAEEALSRGLSSLFSTGRITFISAPRGCCPPTHVLYADDLFIFCRGNVRSLRSLRNFLDKYGCASGQLVNASKSTFYLGSSSVHRKAHVSRHLGFRLGVVPFTYLGVPIFRGKPKRIHFQALVDKAKARLLGWKGKLLSMAGRFQLVQSVYQSLLLHSFSVYQLPSCVLKHLSACARNFIWSGDLSSQKLVIVDWSMVCGPKKVGGLGLRDLASLNLTALLSFG
ncbi:hypothetical protein COP2_048488 [Malus domestica]